MTRAPKVLRKKRDMLVRHILLLVSVTALILIVVVRENHASEELEDDGKEISFRWAVFCTDHNNKQQAMNIIENPTVYSGDSLKIFIQPEENAYVYLYLVDSSNELKLLFPAKINDFDDNYEFGRSYYIPQSGRQLTIDQNKGRETLFLLASEMRLGKLETLTGEHVDASGRDKEDTKAKVIAEIKNTKRRFSRLAVFAEKPVPILGTTARGEDAKDTSIVNLAVKVNAANFYSKTIRLEHK